MYYNPTIYIYINKAHVSPMRHVGVRVALSRGLACNVAPTWDPCKNHSPFYHFLIILNVLNRK